MTTTKRTAPTRAIVKFNNGNGALLCNDCHIIIAYGFDHEDKEHYCDKCAEKRKVNGE